MRAQGFIDAGSQPYQYSLESAHESTTATRPNHVRASTKAREVGGIIINDSPGKAQQGKVIASVGQMRTTGGIAMA